MDFFYQWRAWIIFFQFFGQFPKILWPFCIKTVFFESYMKGVGSLGRAEVVRFYFWKVLVYCIKSFNFNSYLCFIFLLCPSFGLFYYLLWYFIFLLFHFLDLFGFIIVSVLPFRVLCIWNRLCFFAYHWSCLVLCRILGFLIQNCFYYCFTVIMGMQF